MSEQVPQPDPPVPAPPPPAPPPPPPPAAGNTQTVAEALEAAHEARPGEVIDLNAIRQATSMRNEETADIVEKCILAGMPALAADFIRRGMTPQAVTADLQRRQAEAQEANQIEVINTAAIVRPAAATGEPSEIAKTTTDRFARQMGRT